MDYMLLPNTAHTFKLIITFCKIFFSNKITFICKTFVKLCLRNRGIISLHHLHLNNSQLVLFQNLITFLNSFVNCVSTVNIFIDYGCFWNIVVQLQYAQKHWLWVIYRVIAHAARCAHISRPSLEESGLLGS